MNILLAIAIIVFAGAFLVKIGYDRGYEVGFEKGKYDMLDELESDHYLIPKERDRK